MQSNRLFFLAILLTGCSSTGDNTEASLVSDSTLTCQQVMPARIGAVARDSSILLADTASTRGMVWINGGSFSMGAADNDGKPDEYPRHRVDVSGFWMDEKEVTNEQFSLFVKATGYITTAEKTPDWEELKKQLPPGTPRPDDSQLVAASLVFVMPSQPVSLNDASQWWQWTAGANWKHPQGPGSNIDGKEQLPVVQISWYDAVAYASWSGKSLPTEAEWEFAARGGTDHKYSWGDETPGEGKPKANTWQGEFPVRNTGWDKYTGLAPTGSFAPNGFGLYDMAGNVWEWCLDWYQPAYYQSLQKLVSVDPSGPASSYDPMEPTVPKRVVRGGSFLCHDSYCKGYRVTSRMKTSPDTGLEHTGFRCVYRKKNN